MQLDNDPMALDPDVEPISPALGKKRVRRLVFYDVSPTNWFNQSVDEMNGNVLSKSQQATEDEEKPLPKAKKSILHKALVDTKIELTDTELRESREQYDQEQARIKYELAAKKQDKQAYFHAMDVRSSISFRFVAMVNVWSAQLMAQPPSFCTSVSLFLYPYTRSAIVSYRNITRPPHSLRGGWQRAVLVRSSGRPHQWTTIFKLRFRRHHLHARITELYTRNATMPHGLFATLVRTRGAFLAALSA